MRAERKSETVARPLPLGDRDPVKRLPWDQNDSPPTKKTQLLVVPSQVWGLSVKAGSTTQNSPALAGCFALLGGNCFRSKAPFSECPTRLWMRRSPPLTLPAPPNADLIQRNSLKKLLVPTALLPPPGFCKEKEPPRKTDRRRDTACPPAGLGEGSKPQKGGRAREKPDALGCCFPLIN